jgi:hypothetical protein
MVENAFLYRRRGFSVMSVCWTQDSQRIAPLPNHGDACQHPGKQPLIAWKSLQNKALEETEIEKWWHASLPGGKL